MAGEVVGVEAVASCGIGQAGEVGEFEADLEEGVPYITGYRETSHHKYVYKCDSITQVGSEEN